MGPAWAGPSLSFQPLATRPLSLCDVPSGISWTVLKVHSLALVFVHVVPPALEPEGFVCVFLPTISLSTNSSGLNLNSVSRDDPLRPVSSPQCLSPDRLALCPSPNTSHTEWQQHLAFISSCHMPGSSLSSLWFLGNLTSKPVLWGTVVTPILYKRVVRYRVTIYFAQVYTTKHRGWVFEPRHVGPGVCTPKHYVILLLQELLLVFCFPYWKPGLYLVYCYIPRILYNV